MARAKLGKKMGGKSSDRQYTWGRKKNETLSCTGCTKEKTVDYCFK